MYVEPKLTILDQRTAGDALKAAYKKVLNGIEPDPNQMALMLAQSALETGNWRKIYNYNFGNIKAGNSWAGNRTSFSCSEVIDGKEQHFKAGDPHAIFRAYANAELGAIDYLEVLLSNVNWRKGFLSGQPAEFVKWLTAPDDPSTPRYEGKYFTASPDRYLKTITSLFLKFGGNLEDKPKPVVSVVSLPELQLPVLLRGSTGPAVKHLQRLLVLFWGERDLKVDGFFGPVTESTVRRCQARMRLPTSGSVGKDFWELVIS